jgi:hypothetical protein
MACGDVIPSLDQVAGWPAPPPGWAGFVQSVKTGFSKIKNARQQWVKAIDTYHQSGIPIRKGAELTRALFESVLVAKQP